MICFGTLLQSGNNDLIYLRWLVNQPHLQRNFPCTQGVNGLQINLIHHWYSIHVRH